MPAVPTRSGGRVVNTLDQTNVATALAASSASTDVVVDTRDSDFLAVIAKGQYSPTVPATSDFTVGVLPFVDGAFWTAGAPIPRTGQSAAVSGTIVYRIETFDVRAFNQVKVRYSNAHATQAITFDAWVSESVRQGA